MYKGNTQYLSSRAQVIVFVFFLLSLSSNGDGYRHNAIVLGFSLVLGTRCIYLVRCANCSGSSVWRAESIFGLGLQKGCVGRQSNKQHKHKRSEHTEWHAKSYHPSKSMNLDNIWVCLRCWILANRFKINHWPKWHWFLSEVWHR